MPDRPMPEHEAVVLLLTDPGLVAHAWPGHLERPERVEAVTAGVADGARAAGASLVRRSAPPITIEAAAAIHARGYLDWLVARGAAGGGWVDADTYIVEASPAAAFLAAGLATAATEASVGGDADVAFAAVRPPGHHARRDRGSGFCLLNNVAIAAAALRTSGAAPRVAILDWDVHHGDGTQAIFAADLDVFYASTHQFPWYPGSGSAAERTETTINVPLSAGSGDRAFVSAWRQTIVPLVESFRPAAILISAGYDAHRDDPLAGLLVTTAGFRAVATEIGMLAAGLGLPGAAVILEGGYDLDALRTSTAATVEGLLDGLGLGAGRIVGG